MGKRKSHQDFLFPFNLLDMLEETGYFNPYKEEKSKNKRQWQLFLTQSQKNPVAIFCENPDRSLKGQFSLLMKRNGGIWNSDSKNYTISLFAVEWLIRDIDEIYNGSLEVNFKCQPSNLLENLDNLKNKLKQQTIYRSHLKFDSTLLKLPPVLGKPPYEKYQEQDIETLINTNRYLLEWGTGAGKSYAISYVMELFKKINRAQRFLILTSKSGVGNLKQEFIKFTSFKDEDIFTMSSVQGRNRDVFIPDRKVVILSYSTYRFVADYYYEKKTRRKGEGVKYRISPIPFEQWLNGDKMVFILDESHNISNPSTKQSQIVESTKPFAQYIYAFTGTFSNKFEKMYAQLKILDPYLTGYMNYSQWCSFYNDIGTYYSEFAINPRGWRQDRIKALNDEVYKSYGVKRLSKDVLNLKNHFVVPLHIDMSETHRGLYKDFVEEYFKFFQQDVDNSISVNSGQKRSLSLTQIVKQNVIAFQACVDNPLAVKNNPRFDKLPEELKTRINTFSYERDCAKFSYLEELLEQRIEFAEEKGIIWYDHPSTGLVLNQSIKYPHEFVYSGMNEEIIEVVNRFKKDKKKKVLIASIRIMNSSVTITEAKFNIFAERTYDTISYQQCLGRINRIGQDQDTTTYSFIQNKSLDILQDKVLTDGGIILENLLTKEFLSIEQWAQLFNGRLDSLI